MNTQLMVGYIVVCCLILDEYTADGRIYLVGMLSDIE